MGDNETGSSSNVAMVAGLGFFLLVLLLVLVQMYRNYRRVRSTTAVCVFLKSTLTWKIHF